MTDMRSCAKAGLGFALLAGLATSVALGAGSDAPDGSVTIPGLPYSDSGDTTANTDVLIPLGCGTGATSPDTWYTYTPDADVTICMDVCGAGFDTILYVLDSGFAEVTCQDDACASTGGSNFASAIDFLSLTGGSTYYIGIDGWGTAEFGTYTLNVASCDAPPPFECPDGAGDEGEDCVDGAPDLTNGGCNSTPAVFSDAACGDVICGTAWFDGSTRDTDWYQVAANAAITEVTMSMESGYDGVFGRIEQIDQGANPDCATNITGFIAPFALTAANGGPVSIVSCVAPDIFTWWFAGPQFSAVITCGGGTDGYAVSWECGGACTPPPCCTLGDADENGSVGFTDLTKVLANWGLCPF